jgi:hypothetical protein
MGDMFGNLQGSITLTVAAPFLVIGVIFLIMWLFGRIKIRAARDWPSVSGKILFGTVERRRSRGSRSGSSHSYYPSIVYEYTVNGQRYQNNRVTLGSEVGRGSYAAVERKVARYPVGSSVEVFYNPDNPLDAALEKTAPAGNIFLLIALLMLAILACTIAGSLVFTSQIMGASVR